MEAGNHLLAQGLKGIGTPRIARDDKLHHKFAVIDNKTVITGSFNWSPSAAHTNDETLLVIHSPELAKHFTREMDRLWDSADLGITPHIQRKLDRHRIRCGDGVKRNQSIIKSWYLSKYLLFFRNKPKIVAFNYFQHAHANFHEASTYNHTFCPFTNNGKR